MKIAKGPRPWPIHLFAALLLSSGLAQLISGLSRVGDYNFGGFNPITGEWLSDDALIVMLSAEFTIVCIPIVAIWLFRSRIARWLITIFVLWGAITWLMHLNARHLDLLLQLNSQYIFSITVRVITWLAVLLLFLPQSARWFAQLKEGAHAVFE
ncbi:hypothetical protein [Qipengyuania sp. ASV99]|uniref:hypothetical protein n=1 Tax=Qipengyuania sp. ASV99 TaxID=3399681 RepID=UPI003A4C5E25